MSQVQFTHLHTHSPEGSLLDGFMRIEKAIAKVKANGMDALGISDHGTMAAHYKFNKLCKEEGIHPVFGCCMPGQMIYTKKGVIPIEEVKVGDYVLTHKGNYKKVLRHWGRKYTGKIYGLNQLSNETVWLTGEHPVLLKKHIQKRPYFNSENKMEWIRADEILADNNYIEIKETRDFRKNNKRTVHEYYTCFPRISGNYKTLNIQNYIDNDIWREKDNEIHKVKKYNKFDNTVQYNTIPSNVLLDEKFAKLLGYFTAEGSFISGRNKITGLRFTFNINEVEYHNEVKFLLEEIFGVNVTLIDYPEKTITEIFASSIPLAQFFEFLTGNGARNKYISSEILTSPKSVQKSFLEGLENGDGKITKDRVTLKFASKNLTYGVKQLLANLGYGSSVRKTMNPLNGKRFEHYYTAYAPNKEKWVYTDRDEDYIYFPLKNVETKDYNGLVYNFEVEDDNSYVTDIVLHNCEAYITYDKTYKKENFEHIDIVKDEEGNYQFKFLKDEERIRGNWFPATSFSTKKRQNEVERLAKETYGIELLKAEVGEEDMPTKKYAITRQVNSIFKEYYKNGYQLCLQADTSQRDFFSWFPWSGHLLLIARNDEGYQNLLRLNNIANVEGFYRKPRVDYKDIEKYGKGIIATTACRGSAFNQLLLRGRQEEAEEELQRYIKAFDKVYVELQPSRDPDQLFVNEKGQEIAKKYNLPIIVTTDAHMVDKDEEDLHSTMTNIGQGSSNYEEDESDISAYDTAYLMTQEEILSYGIPLEALQNAYDLSHECEVTFLDDISVKYPEYEVPAGYTFDSYLSELAWNGLFDLFLTKDYITDYDTYQERLEYELQIIKDKGLSAYFIIVWDYINWSKEQEIYMSPARGSGGGSLVALALGITYGLDPIKYSLLFERFLNPERNSLPDIDSDFSSHRRHEVIEYLQDKYGINHIANIGTYQTMTSKAILKNVSKVMGIDHNIVNEWNKNIPAPNGNVMPIGIAIEEIPVIKEASEKYPELFELAEELQKMPKSKGVHASGVQISPVELSNNLPLMVSRSGEVTTQYEGGPLEDIGYVKFDVLGVKVLSVIELAINLIKERHDVTINIRELEPTDRNVFRLIKEGNTGFLFQIASPGMTDIFKQLNKVDFDSLIAGISLYRPGPMQFIPNYISRANGETEVTYATEELESILKPTFGVVVYQESVMEITKVLGGYSSGAADLFRKAIGKKSQKVMDEELPKLHKSIMDNGYSKDIADEVQNIIEPFIGYGFNKSHAAAYSLVAYYTAYLKTYYPLEFYIGNLIVSSDNIDKITELINDARRNDLVIHQPNINTSQRGFSALSDTDIIYGFEAIKSLNKNDINKILKTRPYDSVDDFIFKIRKENNLNKRSLSGLVYSGCFDTLEGLEGLSRAEIEIKLMTMLDKDISALVPHVNDFDNAKKARLEKEYLGTYINGHPLASYTKPINWDDYIGEDKQFSTLAEITSIKAIVTKKGDPMAFLGLSMPDLEVDAVCFPYLWDESTIHLGKNRPKVLYKHILNEGVTVRVRGKIEEGRNGLSVIISSLSIPLKYNKDYYDLFNEIENKHGIMLEETEETEETNHDIDYNSF